MKIRTYLNTIVFSIIFLQLILVPAAGAANKIMPLGDSITQGISSGVPDEALQVSYRKALYDKLEAAGYVVNDEIFVGTLFSGESVADFDPDHDGHPGWQTDEIVHGNSDELLKGKLADWLTAKKPNIVLLHIGTNDISFDNQHWDEVEALLKVIDNYETSPSGNAVWVVLSLIINRSCDPFIEPCDKSAETTAFNKDVRDFVFFGREAGGDKIVLVDMEKGAGIDYRRWNMGGDMYNDLHPFETGFTKMADLWFTGLMDILPQADAGPDQDVNEFETVELNATGSVGVGLSYQWTQTAGTPIVDMLPDAQAVQPTFEAPDAGLTGVTLTFMLTVTDDDALVSTDTVDIIVAKIQPQADAGPDQAVNNSAVVTLDASGSVGVGLVYQWTQTRGTTVGLSDAQAVKPTFNASDVGPNGATLTFELTVTDEDNIASTDMVDIEVKPSALANAGPDQNVDEFDTVTLDASGSVPAGDLSYQWTQTAGTNVALSDAQAVKPTFAAPNVGSSGETLTFQLSVTDADNLESTDTVNISVHNPSSSDGGGGGGGGGGCFIATAAHGSSTASGGITSLVAPPWIPVATLEFVAALVVFTSLCAAIALRKRRKRWIKPYHRRYPNSAHN